MRPLCGRGSGASGPARQAGGGEVGKLHAKTATLDAALERARDALKADCVQLEADPEVAVGTWDTP